VDNACPPLKALLYIMAEGHYEGKDADHADIRQMFTSDYLLNSDWYQQRLCIEQERNIRLWQRHAAYINTVLDSGRIIDEAEQSELQSKLLEVERQLDYLSSDDYQNSLMGSIGADWIDRNMGKSVSHL
jgi:hypothetical protein